MFKLLSLCWLHKLKDRATKLFSGVQFGSGFSSGAEALTRLFQCDVEDLPHGILGKLDSINFFTDLDREAIIDGSSLLGNEFASYIAGLYSTETVYAWDRPTTNSRAFFPTIRGTIQGDTLATLLACLTILPAMVHFNAIFRDRYPTFQYSCQSKSSDEALIQLSQSRLTEDDFNELEKLKTSFPSIENIIENEKTHRS